MRSCREERSGEGDGAERDGAVRVGPLAVVKDLAGAAFENPEHRVDGREAAHLPGIAVRSHAPVKCLGVSPADGLEGGAVGLAEGAELGLVCMSSEHFGQQALVTKRHMGYLGGHLGHHDIQVLLLPPFERFAFDFIPR